MADAIDRLIGNLGLALRYVAPGLVAYFVWALLCPSLHSRLLHSGYPLWATLVGVSLVGVLIYSIHAGVLVQIIGWCLIRALPIPLAWVKVVFPKLAGDIPKRPVFVLDTQRWLRRAEPHTSELSLFQRELDRWPELLNFQYCCSYVLILFPLFSSLCCERSPIAWFLFAIGIIIFVFALFSSCRIIDRQLWLRERRCLPEYPPD